jgi:TolA-binding protein
MNYFISKRPQIESAIEKRLLEESSSLFEAKKYEDAAKKYQEILTRFPNYQDASKILFFTGLSYLNAKKYDESILYFQKLVEEYPEGNDAPTAVYKLAVAYFEKGDIMNMQDAIIRLSNKYPNAPSTLFKDAKDIELQVLPSVLLRGAETLFQLGKISEALNLYQLLLKDYSFDPNTTAKAILGIGACQVILKNETEAMTSFQRIVDNYPQSIYTASALYYISRIYQDQNNYAKAKEYCKIILDKYSFAPQWILDRSKECLQE